MGLSILDGVGKEVGHVTSFGGVVCFDLADVGGEALSCEGLKVDRM
jgi:hypothetical protein